jgi:hypothetical protein
MYIFQRYPRFILIALGNDVPPVSGQRLQKLRQTPLPRSLLKACQKRSRS